MGCVTFPFGKFSGGINFLALYRPGSNCYQLSLAIPRIALYCRIVTRGLTFRMELLMTACVLVINNHQEISDLYYDLLNSDEYELELSDYAFENLETIERLHPTLIILDFPVFKRARSWRLLQQLKMYSKTASIRLILCTASLRDVREQEEYLQKQGIAIFYSPFSSEDFVQTVHSMLRTPVRRAS